MKLDWAAGEAAAAVAKWARAEAASVTHPPRRKASSECCIRRGGRGSGGTPSGSVEGRCGEECEGRCGERCEGRCEEGCEERCEVGCAEERCEAASSAARSWERRNSGDASTDETNATADAGSYANPLRQMTGVRIAFPGSFSANRF